MKELNGSTNLDFKMYLNPANEKVTLIISYISESGLNVIFSDITGKLVIKQKVNSLDESLNINTLPSGMYYGDIELPKKISLKLVIHK